MIIHPRSQRAFTLIELLTVIAIIAVLMGLLFPAVTGAQQAAKKAQAKNDLVNITNAIKMFYTEYGRYPEVGAAGIDTLITSASGNAELMNILRGIPSNNPKNPRGIVFLDAPIAKRVGNRDLGGVVDRPGGHDIGTFVDPWGHPYQIAYDNNYDNNITNRYNDAGASTLRSGAIAWSIGKDGNKQDNVKASDDVISWQ
jgi:prepilin-type N-terminal cleavage/methylation domain-containing protein